MFSLSFFIYLFMYLHQMWQVIGFIVHGNNGMKNVEKAERESGIEIDKS